MKNNRRDFLKKSIIFGAFSIFATKILTNCFPVRKDISNIELIKGMGGVGREALECQKAFAAYIGPVIRNILSITDSGRWVNCCKWDETGNAGLIIPLNISSDGYDRENCRIL